MKKIALARTGLHKCQFCKASCYYSTLDIQEQGDKFVWEVDVLLLDMLPLPCTRADPVACHWSAWIVKIGGRIWYVLVQKLIGNSIKIEGHHLLPDCPADSVMWLTFEL